MQNPFRYRGYYYDTETELYYLNSRYYDPMVGRYINGDSVIDNRRTVTQNVGLSMMCYTLGKLDRTCFGDFQLRGRIGKLL